MEAGIWAIRLKSIYAMPPLITCCQIKLGISGSGYNFDNFIEMQLLPNSHEAVTITMLLNRVSQNPHHDQKSHLLSKPAPLLSSFFAICAFSRAASECGGVRSDTQSLRILLPNLGRRRRRHAIAISLAPFFIASQRVVIYNRLLQLQCRLRLRV